MSSPRSTRRDLLKTLGAAAASIATSSGADARSASAESRDGTLLSVDPEPRYALSPYLYMQFMEPLGVTDGSVAAAWDAARDCWREDVIEATRQLGPTLIRWGGILIAYYRWREGVGPRDRRKPMLNLRWGGVETNQVGTHEFVDFCRQVGAKPFCCVNFESEGQERWRKTPKGDLRVAGPEEAAEWVDYCNNPANEERTKNGAAEPFDLRLWQIGNETSYGKEGFDVETAARRTIAFAKAMRAADPTIELIGWGDSGWARRMIEIAGEHLQYVAFHHHFGSGLPNSPLRGTQYRQDPELTWHHLMNAFKSMDGQLKEMREQIKGTGIRLAMTEGHFALRGRNRCEVLSTWAAGVANARVLNVQARHGDILKIATLADFCGTRWQTNALMIPVPTGQSFMMPVARVMSLFRHHSGEQAVDVRQVPEALDVTASQTGNRVFLHIVNTERSRAVTADFDVQGARIASGRVFTLATDPEFEVFEHRPGVLEPVETRLPANARSTFPAASVSAVELEIEETRGETRS
jgi:alpha-L-arabinofuranosidase